MAGGGDRRRSQRGGGGTCYQAAAAEKKATAVAEEAETSGAEATEPACGAALACAATLVEVAEGEAVAVEEAEEEVEGVGLMELAGAADESYGASGDGLGLARTFRRAFSPSQKPSSLTRQSQAAKDQVAISWIAPSDTVTHAQQ